MAFFRFASAALTAFAFGVTAQAQTTAEKFGTMPETWDAEISPDGKHLALGCSPTGVRAICLYELDSDARPRLITPPDKARIEYLEWASPNYLLYYVSMYDTLGTSSGLRSYTFRRIASYNVETGKSEILMPREKFWVSTAGIDSYLVDDDEHVMVQLGDKTMRVNLRTGNTRRITNVKNTGWVAFDEKGGEVAGVEWRGRSLRIVNYVEGDKTVYEWNNFDEADMARITISGIDATKSRMFIDFRMPDRYGLHQIDLNTGELTAFLYNDRPVGATNVIRNPFDNAMIGFTYADDLPRHAYTDKGFAEIAETARGILKSDSVTLQSWTRDQSLFTVLSRKRGQPDAYYLYDRSAPSISPIGGQAPWLADTTLGEVKAFSYTARDGMALNGYYTLPPGKGVNDGPFPIVLMPHGGPQARDYATFDWMAQALASQGYLVIQPNFRGSSGYGWDYLSAGYGEFGDKMVLDVIDAGTWAVAEGLGKPNGTCVIGASYGGYSALMSAIHDPDGVGCAISINGVTDPIEMMTEYGIGSTAMAYWELYMGDYWKSSQMDKAVISPFRRANDLKAATLLLHGREDTTVPVGQSRALARQIEKRPNARYVEIDGDDHYLSSTPSRVSVLEESLAFLATHHPAH